MKGVRTRTKLFAVDCLYIGLIAKFRMEFTGAVEWLKVAKRLARVDGTVDVPTVQTELVDTIKDVNNFKAFQPTPVLAGKIHVQNPRILRAIPA